MSTLAQGGRRLFLSDFLTCYRVDECCEFLPMENLESVPLHVLSHLLKIGHVAVAGVAEMLVDEVVYGHPNLLERFCARVGKDV